MNVYDYYITPEEYERAARNGVDPANLERRIRLDGWDKERAINTPLRKLKDRKYWANIAKKNGIKYNTFMNRVHKLGWTEEKAATYKVEGTEERRKKAAEMTEKNRIFPKKYVMLAEKNGIPYKTFRARIVESKWDMERAATEPLWTFQATRYTCSNYGRSNMNKKA